MTVKPLTDAEVICSWMEPRPTGGPGGTRLSPKNWWYFHQDWEPRVISLNACHEVETRLIEMHKARWYDLELRERGAWWLWNVDAPTKIAALAAVLRPLVEGAGDAQKEQQNA